MDKYGKWIHVVSVAEAPEKPPVMPTGSTVIPTPGPSAGAFVQPLPNVVSTGKPVDSLQISGV